MAKPRENAGQIDDFSSDSSDLFSGPLSSIDDEEENKLTLQALSASYPQSKKLKRVLASDFKREKLARRQVLTPEVCVQTQQPL